MSSVTETDPVDIAAVPPLPARLQLVRAALIMIFVLCTTLIVQLVVVSRLQHAAAQGRSFDAFRERLALGTAPIGPVDEAGDPLAPGTPVALLEIRAIGLREVVGEGTTPAVLFDGPGHRRDTPLPGQAGISVVFGRAAAYGGPFSDLSELRTDDVITVTTGQGVFDFEVVAIRRDGDPLPDAIAADSSRLTLMTADGTPFLPSGVLRVDADLVGDATGGPARDVTADELPSEEALMAVDTSTLWALVLWLQALLVVSLATVWSWHRWGRPQTWIVMSPLLLLVGISLAGELARLLPNLL